MADEYTLLELESPTGDESFTLYINGELTTEVTKDVTTDTLSANMNELIGTSINVNSRSRTLNCIIAGVSADDYPNSELYDNHNHGYAREIELAANDWGTLIKTDGLDNATLYWDRGGYMDEINGTIQEVTHSLIPSDLSSNADTYDLTITFEELDFVYE